MGRRRKTLVNWAEKGTLAPKEGIGDTVKFNGERR